MITAMPASIYRLLCTNIVFVVLRALSATFAANNTAKFIKLIIQGSSLLFSRFLRHNNHSSVITGILAS